LKIAVIIPTYDEAENLPRLISALFFLPLEIHLIVVDDNSPDGTGKLADESCLEYPGRIEVIHRPGKLGLRSAYLTGFKSALERGMDAIVQMDADYSHDPSSLGTLVKHLAGCQVVLGSRYISGGSVDSSWSPWRKGLSAWGNLYARTLLKMPFRDVTSGYRVWRSESLRKMPLDRIHSNGYVFLVEMAYLAHRLGYKICEVPIHFEDRQSGRSKMNFWIQAEAAFRIWQLLWIYRDLGSV
jgi:dolichol-phosphate mannosyltransferase